MGKLIKRREGITLIALVITIVVLLILAGVSIAMLTGDNGILIQAQNAKKETEEAERNEKLDLLKQEDLINETLNGVEVEQVTDEKPGELEKEDENTLVINSIEDLVFFAYDVTNGNNYSGKTVKLGTSLDFNSSKSYVDPLRTDYGKYGYNGELKTLLTTGEGFIPIGKTSNIDIENYSFAGTFDGNNNVISGLYMNKQAPADEEMRIGLFANNKGIIKNIRIINSKIELTVNSKTVDVGAIAAKNYQLIENSFAIGEIKVYSNVENDGLIRVGGIISGNEKNAKIINSFHKGNIYLENNIEENSAYVGGIAVGSNNNSEFFNCYSDGEINGKNLTYVGGCVSSNNGRIKNCYNSKKIEVENFDCIGGIVALNSGEVNNCYNIGKINNVASQTSRIGSIIGVLSGTNPIVKNCYYLTGTAEKSLGGNIIGDFSNVLEKTEEEMKQDSFVELLNNGESNWKKDTNNINNGYPILNFE